VTLNDLIPALKGHGRRRAVDAVQRLRENEIALLTNLHAAGDAIAILRQDLAEAHRRIVELEEAAVADQAKADRLADERDYWRDDALQLRARFSTQLAADANEHAITVPPAVRPIDGPEDQATQPIPVVTLAEAAAAGRLGPVTDPGHI